MTEIWKDIEGYEGLYQVSSFGRVKSVDRYVISERCTSWRKGKILSSGEVNGYLQVSLCKDGVTKNYKVHRLVTQAFIPNIENKPEVDHIDGDRKNNKVDNLKWATHKENMNNPITYSNMYNRKQSEETKEKIREKLKIHIRTEEHCRHISESKKGCESTFKGKHHSDESKKKISEACKGRPAWNKGKTLYNHK